MNNPATTSQTVTSYEVATRMLTNPLLRLTNKERKNLKQARQQAAPSTRPIIKGPKGYQYMDVDDVPDAKTVPQRLFSKTFKQLANLAKRLPKARRRLVRLRFKTSKQDVREALTRRIEYIESLLPHLETEFLRRGHNISFDAAA